MGEYSEELKQEFRQGCQDYYEFVDMVKDIKIFSEILDFVYKNGYLLSDYDGIEDYFVASYKSVENIFIKKSIYSDYYSISEQLTLRNGYNSYIEGFAKY